MITTPRSFRFSCRSREIPSAEALLRAQGYDFEPEPFFGPARRLLREPEPLGRSLAAFFGLIYIQDRSSMLPALALDPGADASVLDMCASPGGKTGQAARMTGDGGFVLANEPSPSRLATLRRNMGRLGLVQVGTCCHKGEDITLPDESWDHILLDPPCSGWGTVERNPRVTEIWTEEKIPPLIRLQRALLREATRLLRPGGTLVYSTCTTNARENEEQICHACDDLGFTLETLPVPPGFALTEPGLGLGGVWRLEPGDGQGFFVARLRKAGRSASLFASPSPLPGLTPPGPRLEYQRADPALLLEQGLDPADLPGPVGMFQGSLHVLPPRALETLPASFRWQGMYLGKAGKNGALKLSPRLRLGDAGILVDLEGETGIRVLTSLLQGQSLACETLPLIRRGGGAAKDATSALLRWEGLPLGRAAIRNKRLFWTER